MKKRLIIFSGYNQRAVISLLRECVRLQVNASIIASSSNDTIFKTVYSDLVIVTRENVSLSIDSFVPLFELISNKYIDEEFVIAPSTESLIRLFLENRDMLTNYRCILPVTDKRHYELISDKSAFYELCEKNNLKVPLVYQDIHHCPEKFVAKNKFLQSAKTKKYLAPVLIYDISDKEDFLRTYDVDDYYYEEYLDPTQGGSYYLLYYFFKNQSVQKFSQENILQQADGKSIVIAKSADIHNTCISQKYEDLFHKLGFRGLVMVELRKHNDEYYMIEANPRMWGPSQLCIDSGISMLHAFLYDWGLTNVPVEVNPKEKYYCWSGGIRENLIEHKKLSVLCNAEFSVDQIKDIFGSDIYCREDTMMIFRGEQG